jgi:hypothetical protein
MARPRAPRGFAGQMKTVAQVQEDGRWVRAAAGTKPQRWRARVKFRDRDGQLRDVERFASTKGRAETKLREALGVLPRDS